MNLSKACEIFYNKSIDDIESDGVDRIYKKLMIKYHPDNFGDDTMAKEINIARSVLTREISNRRVLKETSNKDKEFIIVGIDELINIYLSRDTVRIRRLQTNNTYVFIELDIVEMGSVVTKNAYVKFNQSARYEMDIEFRTIDNKLKFNMYGKSYNGEIETASKTIVNNFDCGVAVTLHIRRVVACDTGDV